jgi:hypothetical protein
VLGQCLDGFIGLANFEENNVVMVVVVDQLTKYGHFCFLSHPFKASTPTTFMETINNLHGNPNIIVSDREPIFTSNI